jgi:glyoxylase-like metal-dependent hydrolase (beta-lactamase superfamily II)
VWERVLLGSVSAYVVVRGGEAAVIDTGGGGSVGAIEEVLADLGIGWGAVGHIVVTHDHGDHQGSLGPAMEAAPGATGYAGALDIPDLRAPRGIVAVGDGDSVLGIDVIETPGHTPGHISLIDEELSLLIAGDALVGEGGGVGGPVPRFTDDLDLAFESVIKLGGFTFEAAVFGHGEPVDSGASRLVAELGAGR